MSRAYTAEETRAHFLDNVKNLACYWASLPNKSPQERCDGVAFSLLCLLDGVHMGFPAVDLLMSPHPDDQKFHEEEDSDWYEMGQKINDCMLHEMYHKAKPGVF